MTVGRSRVQVIEERFRLGGKTGVASSAADTLLFPLYALLHADRRARIFAQDLGERGTGRVLFAERRERLP